MIDVDVVALIIIVGLIVAWNLFIVWLKWELRRQEMLKKTERWYETQKARFGRW